MDKSRQQFEAFIKFHMDDAEINNKFETANNGLNYADRDVDLMWISWQESRESLIGTEVSIDLNLPTDPYHRIFGSINGFNQSNHELVILIEANEDGVKVKHE
ncbi:TPA: hypothetical protein ACPFI9_001029 [Providencia rettgeri]